MKKSGKVNIDSGGGPVFLDKVHNQGVIKGRVETHNKSANAKEVDKLFNTVYKAIDRYSGLSIEDKADLRVEISEIQKEAEKRDKANEGFLMRRLRNIKRMAPDILEVILAVLANKAVGLGVIAKKIAEKIKAEAT
jgi:hypothetical protein